MRKHTIYATFLLWSLGSTAFAEPGQKPLRALLITGGCCHDYRYQAERLVDGSRARAHVEWTVGCGHREATAARAPPQLGDPQSWLALVASFRQRTVAQSVPRWVLAFA